MTSNYQKHLASSGAGVFTLLLFKWKGSLYKLCYRELLVFLITFGLISIIYRFALDQDQKRTFEKLVRYFDQYLGMIPLSFILGFYVTTIATRWWQQYMALPWPDRLMLSISMYIAGSDEESRLLRKTLLRHCNLMMVLVLRSISDSVSRRLPTLDDVVSAGFMTRDEMECYQSTQADINLYWVPGLWFIQRLRDARRRGIIRDAQGVKLIMEEFLDYRGKCGVLWSYDWVTIPLVYTQVVTLATYSFFIACLFGRQYVDHVGNPGMGSTSTTADFYFPFWTVLQFFFYMGLLKVAEQMINPYGDDDEDFELNFLIDRHMKLIHLGADVLCNKLPSMNSGLENHVYANFSPETRRQRAAKRKLSTTLERLYSTDKIKQPDLQKVELIPTISHGIEAEIASHTAVSRPVDSPKLNRLIGCVTLTANRKLSDRWKPPSAPGEP